MKSKGYALVELLIAISISIVLVTAGFKGINFYKELSNKIKVAHSKNQILNILSLGKQYCFEKNIKGNIVITKPNKLSLHVDDSFSYELNLPKDFEFYGNQNISISSLGKLSSTSIIFADSFGKNEKVTIATAFDSITIY